MLRYLIPNAVKWMGKVLRSVSWNHATLDWAIRIPVLEFDAGRECE
jgi:hypothetical protein